MGVVKTIEIKANLKDAEKNFQELNEQLKIQRDVLLDLEKQIYDVEKAQKSTSKSNLSVQKKLADQAKELKNELKGEKLGLRELNNERSASVSQITNLSNAQANSTKIVRGLDKFTGGYATKLKKVFLGAKEAAKGIKVFVSGLSGVKKALIATGVGALVVGLIAVVAYWDDIKKLIGGATVELEKQEEKIRSQISKQEEQISLIESQVRLETLKTGEGKQFTKELKKQLLIQQEQNKELLKNLENQLKLSKGKKGQRQAEEAALKALFGQKTAKNLLVKVQKEEEKIVKKINDVKKQSIGIEIKLAQIDADVIKKKKKNREEQKRADKKKADEELKAKKEAAAEEKRIADKKIADAKTRADLEKEIAAAEANTIAEKRALELAKEKARFEELITRAKAEGLATEELKTTQGERLAEIQAGFDETDREAKQKKADQLKADAEKEIELEEAKTAAKHKALRQLVSIFGAESAMGRAALIGKQLLHAKELLIDLGAIKSKAIKATAEANLGAVESTSSVSTGLAKTLKLGFPAAIPALIGYAASAVGIVSGVLSATKKTKTVAASLGGGGGGSSPVAPPMPQPAAFNVVGASETSQLADSIGGQSQQPSRAYVVSADVTTSQEMDRNTIEGASI